MSSTENNGIQHLPEYTTDLHQVIDSERSFIQKRREYYGIDTQEKEDTKPQPLWGLAISGGGIRSATLGQGLIQRFITSGWMKKFDYLSTVSGGGYIGAAFTSLLNQPPETYVQPGDDPESAPGLDPDTSPLVLLMDRKAETPIEPITPAEPRQRSRYMPAEFEKAREEGVTHKNPIDLDYKKPEATKLDARHQIHHLRTHGEYLTPDKTIFSRDIQRLVGWVIAGILHNMLLIGLAMTAYVCLHYIVFDKVSDHQFFTDMQSLKSDGEAVAATIDEGDWMGSFMAFWRDDLGGFLGEYVDAGIAFRWLFLSAILVGVAGGLLFIFSIILTIRRIKEYGEAVAAGKRKPVSEAGRTAEDYFESRFLKRFNLVNIFGGPVVAGAIWLIASQMGLVLASDYRALFSLPLGWAVGNALVIYLLLPLLTKPDQGRSSRSLMAGLRGGAFYGIVISLLMPVYVLALFSFGYFFNRVVFTAFSGISSVVSVVVGYFALSSKNENNSLLNRLMSNLRLPILSLSVVLAAALATSVITTTITSYMNAAEPSYYLPLIFLAGSVSLFILLGSVVNSNRLSLHYFYRDRLSETYLKTDGRIKPNDFQRQGLPLVNLRNDEDLAIKDIGWRKMPNGEKVPYVRMPYPIIVTALNLEGSDELVRKDQRSDHFIFTPNYSGSNTTGYARGDIYRGGGTKYGRAMTISAAAVHSRMGSASFFAQSFLTTLLNLRLGYWMENPWFYRGHMQSHWIDSPIKYAWLRLRGWKNAPKLAGEKPEGRFKLQFNPNQSFTFWPFYLWQEILGNMHARHRLINLSDGGHNGDNLGLLPLIHRRCKLIVVADFEQDNDFIFQSFNHVVRMANIEENTRIRIDLSPLIPEQKGKDRIGLSEASVATGSILYPDNSEGRLIYIKSSVCPAPASEIDRQLHVPDEPIPVNVFHYHSMMPDFPHQSTADQYFDDAQFEAYRSLGFHLGGLANGPITRATKDLENLS